MNDSKCNVISKEDRIIWGLNEIISESCLYEKKVESNLTEYDGKYYCPLHLPMESNLKDHETTNQYLQKIIEHQFFNFRYIKIKNFNITKIETNKPLFISFSKIDCLSIKKCNFSKGVDIKNTVIKKEASFSLSSVGYITFDSLFSYGEFYLNINTDQINIRKCIFYLQKIPEKYNNPSYENTIKHVEKQSVSISGEEIYELNITGSTFYTHLSINTNNIANIKFDATTNIFHRVPSIITHQPEKFDGAFSLPLLKWKDINTGLKNLYQDNRNHYICQLNGEYDRLKNLYHIASLKLLFENEGNYYVLMHKCMEINTHKPRLERFFSSLYRIFGGYGISLLNPIISLISLFLLFFIIFYYQTDSYCLALESLFYPFKLANEQIKFATSNAKFAMIIYSICSYILITLLVITLRWKFKKK
ncbi:TPA: hypothetical protein I8027_003058 [Legionella pneumophila]|uniref:hypothetical protein n=1 Tax=Legionella pneumophila TaxID=446 RepID=UPI001A227008|nr:hypothetical protein [Legionella pneumophila]HAT2140608.1 hypothetical protein [Legionella pneumophila]HAT9743000.1 hypothetical protein [Legionella pneumophila subsp. pneumophila]